jgi:hypothetical protein
VGTTGLSKGENPRQIGGSRSRGHACEGNRSIDERAN